uniref:Uncharacterized protein n=1 Tax=Odontella aurita TaxID=265563 RepID=A0A6U6CJG3_9STRA|mmetsp:Transcript_13693/g.40032  ORF Transcript_13693/g.40032 Transcript_13693/m.40032 type:complete len:1398 (+) Transcript_13693:1242-5435(+)
MRALSKVLLIPPLRLFTTIFPQVHISTFAWITVASFVNLLYFLLGITAYVTVSQETVALAMGAIYTGLMIVFVPLAWVIGRKMKVIFQQIMHMKLINLTAPDEEDDDGSESVGSYDQEKDSFIHMSKKMNLKDGAAQVDEFAVSNVGDVPISEFHQLDLFWGGDPHLIIGAFQFMQLGYAIAASVLLIFWTSIKWGDVFKEIFIIVILVCYFLFVITMAKVMPRYTLCTSLGQLVNRRRLHETMATFKLEEAKRKRRHKLEEVEIRAQLRESMRSRLEPSRQQGRTKESDLTMDTTPPVEERVKAIVDVAGKTTNGIVSGALGVPTGKRDTKQERTGINGGSDEGSEVSDSTCKMTQLAELVQTRTEDLPRHLPPPKTVAQIRSERRRNRMRSMSDGVQLMRQLSESVANLSLTPASSISDAAATELKFSEDGSKPFSQSKPSPLPKYAPAPVGDDGGKSSTVATGRIRSRERRRLQKSQSVNVSMMRTPASSFFGSGNATAVSEEKEEEKCDIRTTTPYSLFGAKPPRRTTSSQGLSSLMEDIPSRSVDAAVIPVPFGRKGTLFGEVKTEPTGEVNAPALAVAAHESEKKDNQQTEEEVTLESFEGGKVWPEPKTLNDIVSGDEDDGDTVNTGDSESGHSDFDDIPEVSPSEVEKRQEPTAPPLTLNSRLELFFLSSKYSFMSGVFGTLLVFFIIGMRVEIMLVQGPNEIITNNENTPHMEADAAFYLEVSWLSLFILISSCCGTIFLPKIYMSDLASNKRSVQMTIAVTADIVLSILCLFILLWAEKNRPSYCKNQDGDYTHYDFGGRLCGGLGNIEPWTSIIVLRVFRFRFSKLVVDSMLRRRGLLPSMKKRARFTDDVVSSSHAEREPNESSLRDSRHDDSIRIASGRTSAQAVFMQENHMPKSLENEVGTIVELWKMAISVYPEVAERYGEFSGELLQAMLGIEINVPRRKKIIGCPGSKGTLSETGTEPKIPHEVIREKEKTAGEYLPIPLALKDLKYSKLDPDAQGIILAGQVGQPVKPCEDPASIGGKSALSKRTKAQFEVDKQKDDEEFHHLFVNPNARLVRSMRRCERRLPPMLDKWAVVDVVLTKEELVYFDARGVDGLCENLDKMDPETFSRMNSVKQALFATKGGKGLRLRDVAVGRKVVGHLELEDVDMVKVECLSPMDESGWFVGDADEEEPSSYVPEEYWKVSNIDTGNALSQSRNQRWKQVTEHRLKLRSLQGLLYLRFYSDLEDADNICLDDETSLNHVHKNDALLWCQTVARLCGSNQLHQDLAHLGEEGSAELQDFLDPISRGGDGKNKKQQALRRVVSKVNVPKLAGSTPRAGSVSERVSALGSVSKNAFGHVEDDGDNNGVNRKKRKSVVRFEEIDVGKSNAEAFEEEEPSDLPV